MEQFVELMRSRMETQGVSHAQLAEMTGLSRQYIYKMLSGSHNVSLETAQKVAESLGFEITIQAPKKKKKF